MSEFDDVDVSNPPEGLSQEAIDFFVATMVGHDGKLVPLRLDTLIRKVPPHAHPELIAALMIAGGHTEGDSRQTLQAGLDRTFQRLFSRSNVEPGVRSSHLFRLVAAGLAQEDPWNYDRIVITPNVQWLLDLYVHACECEKETEQLWLQEWKAGPDCLNEIALKRLYDARFAHDRDLVEVIRDVLRASNMRVNAALVKAAKNTGTGKVLSFSRPTTPIPVGAQKNLHHLVTEYCTEAQLDAAWKLLAEVAEDDTPQA